MTTTLEYVVIGQSTLDNQSDTELELLAYSEGVPSQEIQVYRDLIPLEPIPVPDAHESQAVALLSYDGETAILARTHNQQNNAESPVYQYIWIPYEVLGGIGGRLAPLLTLVQQPFPAYQSPPQIVSPLAMPTIATGILNERVVQLDNFIQGVLDNNFELALTLLGAIIHERNLMIRNFPLVINQRIDLVRGLRTLLPSAAAMRLSFTTYCSTLSNETPMLAFADDSQETSRWVINWNDPQPIPAVLEHPYIQLLQSLWGDDINDFVSDIKPMDILSLSFVHDTDFADNLVQLTERFQLDQQVRHDDEVTTDDMITALEGSAAPQGRLRYQYIEKLLKNALNNRDTEAGTLVAQELDRDKKLDDSLSSLFDEMLESQPDTVYVFIRNRLNNLGVDDKWLPRLKTAARQSLDIAIDEGDGQTLASWLELIAREPQAYELTDILKQGILTAQSRAHEDGELGLRLILNAAKRTPELLDGLYSDDNLMDALPNGVGRALREKTATALEATIDKDPEYFLMVLSYAIQTSEEQLVSKRVVQKLWDLYISDVAVNLPKIYQPFTLIQSLATQNSSHMTDTAIDTLLQFVVSHNDNDLFLDMATHLASRDELFPRLSVAIQKSNQPFGNIQTLMNWVADIENVATEGVLQTSFDLLEYFQWDASTQPMIESVARMLNQNPSLSPSLRHLWKLFESCASLKLESPTRVAMNRLLQQLSISDELTVVVENIVRIHKQIIWSKPLLVTFNSWWRNFTQDCTLVQLQRLDRELENQRVLENQRHMIQTSIAMRRLVGTRDIVEFAESVSTAYTLLESISDAFDTEGKAQSIEVDATTIRNELDTVSGDLSPDERHILAKNLRELAQHITHMADKRSKPSIIRSDEAIDRQLMHGESNPQGSVDVMKWIAGYLGGTHGSEDEE